MALYDWIANEASPVLALAYLEWVEAFCQRLGIGSERGCSLWSAHHRI
ncbi:hypothetical protein [Gemmobacter fulva]|nr:hypothetical protein [Gemmobacter fulvus]MBT9247686.1 hypothetical protein [Gemmobacter fulvus]